MRTVKTFCRGIVSTRAAAGARTGFVVGEPEDDDRAKPMVIHGIRIGVLLSLLIWLAAAALVVSAL